MKYNQPLKDPNTKAQEQEKPFLTVIAKVTPQDAEKAARYYRFVQSLKMTALFALFVFFASEVVTLINGLPLSATPTVMVSARVWLYVLLYFAFSMIYHVWFQPRQARRSLVEIYGDAPAWEMRYSLDSKSIHFSVSGPKSSGESAVRYADLRSMRELRYQILLHTRSRNMLSINKLGMSASDALALAKALRERIAK